MHHPLLYHSYSFFVFCLHKNGSAPIFSQLKPILFFLPAMKKEAKKSPLWINSFRPFNYTKQLKLDRPSLRSVALKQWAVLYVPSHSLIQTLIVWTENYFKADSFEAFVLKIIRNNTLSGGIMGLLSPIYPPQTYQWRLPIAGRVGLLIK